MRQVEAVFYIAPRGKLSDTVTIVWVGMGAWTPGASGAEGEKKESATRAAGR